MTISDKVVANLVGVDIGCGMFVVQLKEKEIDLEKLDKTIISLHSAHCLCVSVTIGINFSLQPIFKEYS